MLKRFGHALLIAAILCATGTHWMVLQSVAWATMLANNARNGDLPAAIEKTFDGEHPCALCKVIASGKQSEKKSELQNNFKKLEFLNEPIVIGLNAPARYQLPSDNSVSAHIRVETPPVPPPRILPG